MHHARLMGRVDSACQRFYEPRDAARRAPPLAKGEYKPLPHVTDVAEAIAANYPFVTEPLKLERGDVELLVDYVLALEAH